jgi:hypothetical protein
MKYLNSEFLTKIFGAFYLNSWENKIFVPKICPSLEYQVSLHRHGDY